MNIQAKAFPQLNVKEIQDVFLQKNFRNLQDYFASQNQLLNFKFVEYVFTGAVQNQKIAHGLNYVPQDVLVSRITGKGQVTFNWGKFDAKTVDVTATDACRVRMFVGSYWNEKNTAGSDATDYQVSSPDPVATYVPNPNSGKSTTTTTVSITSNVTSLGFNYVSKSADYSAFINDWVIASGASFQITLPTAVNQTGKFIIIQHNGATDLSQSYTLATTLSQTINGPGGTVAGGSYLLCTNGEVLWLMSDGSNWQVSQHKTETGWINSGSVALSATSAYVFTVTAANATVGAKYSNNSQVFTVSTTITGTTTLTCSGTGTPGASGTLTKVSGTGDATIAFSSKTVTGVPVFGTTTGPTNFVIWRRNGTAAEILYRVYQSVAGTNGTGDYTTYFPANMEADTTYLTPFTAAITESGTPSDGCSVLDGTGKMETTANAYRPFWFYLYSSTQFRAGYLSGVTANAVFSAGAVGLGTGALAFYFSMRIPVKNWQP